MESSRSHLPACLVWVIAGICLGTGTLHAADLLPPGFRPVPLGVHALVGARVIPRPGTMLNPGTILVRDGLVTAVGFDVTPPPEARVWDMTGTTIYAGFIDLYLALSTTNRAIKNDSVEPTQGHSEDRALTSRAGSIRFFGVPGDETDPGTPGAGAELASITPERRVADTYTPDSERLSILRELGFTVGNVAPAKGVLRGSSVLVTLLNANPNETILQADLFLHAAFEQTRQRDDKYPGSLMGSIAAIRQTFHNGAHYRLDHAHYKDHATERQRPPFNPAQAALLPALDGARPVVFEAGSALLNERAAVVAREFKLPFHLVSCGEEWRRPALAEAADATWIVPLDFPELPRMPEDDDWDQVSLDQLRAWDWAPENAALLRRHNLEIALTTHGLREPKQFRKNLRIALDRGLTEADALAALTVVPARLCGWSERLGTLEPGKIANLTVVEGSSYFDPKTRVREVWIDGRPYPSPAASKTNRPPAQAAKPPAEKAAATKEKGAKREQLRAQRTARAPWDDQGPLLAPSGLLIRNATVWTCGPQGRLDRADILVEQGRIKAMGTNLPSPATNPGQWLILDAKGKHITPGLIDAHSHSMILGRVNETTLPSTAMVRIRDVLNADTLNLHRQLAGGLTVANLLHGSANPIGGQNTVIKLRRGAPPEDLLFTNAPPGIKFALGENVKQSNWGEKYQRRFPQTRMGVPAFIANRFTAASQYLEDLAQHKSGNPPVRHDLELEALGQILQHQRWVHCHSYRQDEILAFLRLAEQFHFQIGTLQHVLEGYKIADEIARHGAGASCFSDWWAYKFEVYDAIPYAGSLMHQRGVLVSFNSDSSDLARRLYLDAAKAVKYGGVAETDALLFVTLNPAKQLRIDAHVGSLEPGKDADLVLWSASPLDSSTRCLQTWIDGKKYFDYDQEIQRASSLEQEYRSLLEKAKTLQKLSGSGEGDADDKSSSGEDFFRIRWEHHYDASDRHCLDHE